MPSVMRIVSRDGSRYPMNRDGNIGIGWKWNKVESHAPTSVTVCCPILSLRCQKGRPVTMTTREPNHEPRVIEHNSTQPKRQATKRRERGNATESKQSNDYQDFITASETQSSSQYSHFTVFRFQSSSQFSEFIKFQEINRTRLAAASTEIQEKRKAEINANSDSTSNLATNPTTDHKFNFTRSVHKSTNPEYEIDEEEESDFNFEFQPQQQYEELDRNCRSSTNSKFKSRNSIKNNSKSRKSSTLLSWSLQQRLSAGVTSPLSQLWSLMLPSSRDSDDDGFAQLQQTLAAAMMDWQRWRHDGDAAEAPSSPAVKILEKGMYFDIAIIVVAVTRDLILDLRFGALVIAVIGLPFRQGNARIRGYTFTGQESDKTLEEIFVCWPTKRKVIYQIRGRSYEKTLAVLEVMPYRACEL
ncbi:hypothetical protein Ahy_A05g022979 isoform D [Arachis hypogaea]|uniref:Uncharacterized protein n=1 Tax=Arachis hypogaea TaxID=3818 RepID=A0A445D274_ARAHY|nr:hypothetical protein Ahy_A05g022979 isoform D [Arachis hypogaea]